MISASQSLGVLVGVSILSVIFAIIYRLQESFKIENRQRLKFLKAYLVMVWMTGLFSLAILALNVGKAIGTLLPANQMINQALSASKAQVLIFESDSSSIGKIILGAYLLGMILMVIRLFGSYFQMRKILLDSSGIKLDGRSVRTGDLISSPFSFGFFNPQIFLPSQILMSQSQKSLSVILAHEETHIANRDPQWKLVSLVTKAVLFFVPSVFYLHRKLEVEMEIECDRLTIQKTKSTVQEYGNLLIDTVLSLQNKCPNPMFTYMSDNNLKRRIQAMKAKTSRRPVLSAVFGALAIGVSMTAIAATSGVSKIKGQYKVKAEILVDGKIVSSPQFIVLPNEPASLEMKSETPESSLRMMLTASDFSNSEIADGIDLKMAIDYKTQDRSFRANPRVVVAPGEEGTVTIGSNSNDTLEMRIKAERQ